MKRFNIEVGASNTIKKEFNSLSEINRALKNCYGRVSIVDNSDGKEIYYGSVEKCRQYLDAALRS